MVGNAMFKVKQIPEVPLTETHLQACPAVASQSPAPVQLARLFSAVAFTQVPAVVGDPLQYNPGPQALLAPGPDKTMALPTEAK